MTTVVCISDTHGYMPAVPDGDVLIYAGDFTCDGTVPEIIRFNAWFSNLPHREKLLIAGNHDRLLQNDPGFARTLLSPSITYLEDSGYTTASGLKVWGSPHTIAFNAWAFGLSEQQLAERWACIPDDTDILVTHGPMSGFLDALNYGNYDHLGSHSLLREVANRLHLKLHVCGHIHPGYGQATLESGTRLVNASVCNNYYELMNDPITIDLP